MSDALSEMRMLGLAYRSGMRMTESDYLFVKPSCIPFVSPYEALRADHGIMRKLLRKTYESWVDRYFSEGEEIPSFREYLKDLREECDL